MTTTISSKDFSTQNIRKHIFIWKKCEHLRDKYKIFVLVSCLLSLCFVLKKLSSFLCKRLSYFGIAIGTQRQFSDYETSLWVLHLDKFSPGRILFFLQRQVIKNLLRIEAAFLKNIFHGFRFWCLWWDCLIEVFYCFTLNYFLFCWFELMKAKQENSCWERDWSQNQT